MPGWGSEQDALRDFFGDYEDGDDFEEGNRKEEENYLPAPESENFVHLDMSKFTIVDSSEEEIAPSKIASASPPGKSNTRRPLLGGGRGNFIRTDLEEDEDFYKFNSFRASDVSRHTKVMSDAEVLKHYQQKKSPSKSNDSRSSSETAQFEDSMSEMNASECFSNFFSRKQIPAPTSFSEEFPPLRK